MKHLLPLLLTFCACTALAQNHATCYYGQNTLQGMLIYKDLIHPARLDTIKNALVLDLPQPILFKPDSAGKGYDDTATTRYIRVYSNVSATQPAELRYKTLIGRPITVTANFKCSPSLDYTLPVNINEDFRYKLIKQNRVKH
jgi:hypothetical protein